MSAIDIDRLTKRYGETVAVDDLASRSTPGGSSVLGPNGAGKTTARAPADPQPVITRPPGDPFTVCRQRRRGRPVHFVAMQGSRHRKFHPGEATLVVSLLWLYVGCRTSARALGAVQSALWR